MLAISINKAETSNRAPSCVNTITSVDLNCNAIYERSGEFVFAIANGCTW